MIDVDKALRIILREARAPGATQVDFRDSIGRVLAEDIVSERDMPPFDKAMMDGYALRSTDFRTIPAVLTCVDHIPAGKKPSKKIGRGECARIMTGAPLPEGCNAVQMVEYTEAVEDGKKVKILRKVGPGEHVMKRGEEASRGEVLLKKRTVISPVETAILAGAGKVKVKVFKRPAVSFFATGDEVIEPGEEPDGSSIRNSTSYFIRSQLKSIGLEPRYLGISRDDASAMRKKLREGFRSDLLLISGGASVGDFDIVAKTLKEKGVRLFFSRVAIKPGKPLLFGRMGKTLVFGMPGNPLSCFTDFTVFGMPAIRKMMGMARHENRFLQGKIQETLKKKGDRTHYRLGKAEVVEGEVRTATVKSAGSSDIISASRGNCFIILPKELTRIPKGRRVDILLWSPL